MSDFIKSFNELLEDHEYSPNSYSGFAGGPENPKGSLYSSNTPLYDDNLIKFEVTRGYDPDRNNFVSIKVDNFLRKYTNKIVYYLSFSRDGREKLRVVRVLGKIRRRGRYFINLEHVMTIL